MGSGKWRMGNGEEQLDVEKLPIYLSMPDAQCPLPLITLWGFLCSPLPTPHSPFLLALIKVFPVSDRILLSR